MRQAGEGAPWRINKKRYEYDAPAEDNWIGATGFQCDECLDVRPEGVCREDAERHARMPDMP